MSEALHGSQRLRGAEPFLFRPALAFRVPNALHLVRAAVQMLRELGINDDAWNEAVTVMGQIRAAVSVLIIDANRSHPITPIHKPGGALRAFSRRDLSGQLNLDGSLIGLLGRCQP